jgi:hypothetical protein
MRPFARDVYRWVPVALGTLLIAAGVVINRAPTVAEAQGQDSSIPRLGAKPNFTGVWQALNEANWDLEPHAARASRVLHTGVPNGNPVPDAPALALGASGGIPASLGVVEGGPIPYKPDALQKRKENAEHSLERDPEVKCLMPGVPRATYMPYPFQITQSDAKIMMAYGYSNTGRTIHLDKVESPGLPTWMGFSAGRWEGDTLVVDVTELIEDTWFDRAGNHHSDNLHVVERYTMTSPNHLMYEATIEDPSVFTRPWKIKMPLYRRLEERARVLEYRCVEMAEELIYGHLRKTQLVKHWEGDYGRRGGRLVIEITRKPSEDDLQ